jgi:hypothetical protein
VNKYVIIYDDNMKLYDSYLVITGKNAKNALYNYYHCNFERVYGDKKKYANVILVKGDYRDNIITPSGAYREYCYSIIKD